MANINALDELLQKTIQAIENSKEEMYKISEAARWEYEQIKKELLTLNKKPTTVIQETDLLEKQSDKSRTYLTQASSDFSKYTEEQTKAGYEKAHKQQLKLLSQRKKEKLLRLQRDNLEHSLKVLEDTIRRSEELIANMGVALKFLTNDLRSITGQIGEVQQIQNFGVSIIRAQEEERKRIAREIHDGPVQSMANILMRSEFCLKLLEQDPSKIRTELLGLISVVRNSLKDIRKIIFDLRPMVLGDLGLIPALKRYIKQYQQEYDIYVEFTISGRERQLDTILEIALFRIIQEALTNIKKHSKAKQVAIKAEFLADKVNVIIKDNGCGFNAEQVPAGKSQEGFGLIGMRERIQLLKGTWNIKSTPGQGTEISLSLPAPE